MKKRIGILLVAALLLPILAGCQSTQQQSPSTTAPAVKPPATTAPVDDYITREEAKTIALQDAGLTEADVRDLEVELDRDDGTVHYDVDFEKGNEDYDYDIDAKTGKILYVQKPNATEGTAAPASSENPSQQLTREEARDIALNHAGVKASEVRGLEVELDRDDGTVHYDVDFEKDGYDYDYEIDAVSGKILKSRKERD